MQLWIFGLSSPLFSPLPSIVLTTAAHHFSCMLSSFVSLWLHFSPLPSLYHFCWYFMVYFCFTFPHIVARIQWFSFIFFVAFSSLTLLAAVDLMNSLRSFDFALRDFGFAAVINYLLSTRRHFPYTSSCSWHFFVKKYSVFSKLQQRNLRIFSKCTEQWF